MDMLAQAALQNQTLNFSTIMKLYNSSSLAEKQRMVEKNERELLERQQQMQQQQMEAEQQRAQMEAQAKEADMQLRDQMNVRDNETKILVANINAQSNNDGIQQLEASEQSKAALLEKMREFDEKLKLDRERLQFDKDKARTDARLKEKQINNKQNSNK